jgi:hypothetical protein
MKNKALRIIAISVIGLAIALLLPEVVSAGWRLIYGPSVTYRSWSIRPPFEWYAAKKGEGMMIERMSHLPWRQGPMIFFQPVHFTKTFPFNYIVYGEVQARSMERKGYEVTEEQAIRVAGEVGACWTFVSKIQPQNLWIACIVPKDLTSADYIGTAASENTFREILSQIKRAN